MFLHNYPSDTSDDEEYYEPTIEDYNLNNLHLLSEEEREYILGRLPTPVSNEETSLQCDDGEEDPDEWMYPYVLDKPCPKLVSGGKWTESYKFLTKSLPRLQKYEKKQTMGVIKRKVPLQRDIPDKGILTEHYSIYQQLGEDEDDDYYMDNIYRKDGYICPRSYISYGGNGFVIYIRTLYYKGTKGENKKGKDKNRYVEIYDKIKSFLIENVENVFIDESQEFCDTTKAYTPLIDKKELIKCRNYAKTQNLDIIIRKVEDVCWNKKDLQILCQSFQERGQKMYVLEKGILINISEYLNGTYSEKMDIIEDKLYAKFAITKLEGGNIDNVMDVKNIEQSKEEIIKTAIETKKESGYEIDKAGKIGKRWMTRMKVYRQTGADKWINLCLGLEEDDGLEIEGKDFQEVYGISVASLVRALESSDLFPIWNGKQKYTPSMIYNIRKECRYGKIKYMWDDEVPPNSKHILEVDEELLKEFSTDLSTGKYDLPERGLVFNDMYPSLTSKK